MSIPETSTTRAGSVTGTTTHEYSSTSVVESEKRFQKKEISIATLPTEFNIDEPALKTLEREFKAMGKRCVAILAPCAFRHKNLMHDHDLWGPLIFSVLFAFFLSMCAGADQEAYFALGFFLLFASAFVISANILLLGGQVRFMPAACLLAYSGAPLVAALAVCAFVAVPWVQAVVVAAAVAWSTAAALFFMGGLVPRAKKPLALFPILLNNIVVGIIVLVVARGPQ